MYNHENQYRCTIIRGKAKKKIDDFLPAYAKVIDEICPCDKNTFITKFNLAFQKYLPPDKRDEKTLNNHRTEISGSLFGMYYCDENGTVYESERTQKFLADNDQPAFFKDICYKLQFPNGMQKIKTVQQSKQANIKVRPFAFLLKTLLFARNAGISLDKKEIGYYILNSLDVLQGKANPLEVIEQITKDRSLNIRRAIPVVKNHSHHYQHINEQINYLELANLVVENNNIIHLNLKESVAINIIANCWDLPLDFDVYAYELETPEEKKQFQNSWDFYYSQLSKEEANFDTTVEALSVGAEGKEAKEAKEGTTTTANTTNKKEIGDAGEKYVFEYEKDRVFKFNTRLANKVLHLGETKGLGYDIQSVIAEPGEWAEFVKYIEVKSTKRVTEPDMGDTLWLDAINITRNEWVAAQQHKEYYSIYRVYFVRGKIVMFVLNNLYQKKIDGKIHITPMTYRVEFNNDAIDSEL
jgi:hypothetical protein